MATHNTPSSLLRLTPLALITSCVCLLTAVFFCTGAIHAATADNKDVRAFFRSVEKSFINKDIAQLVKRLDDNFFYAMTYNHAESFSYLQSDYDKYRTSVGSFFMSKPIIHEYSITVDTIKHVGNDIMVLALVKSVVEMNGIINSCDASSNYLLHYGDGGFFIKSVRGDANCENKTTE